MDTIRIDVGVHTALQIDLTDFDFTGISKLVFTVKNFALSAEPVILEREYTEAKIYSEVITPEESMKLRDGAVYDFDKVLPDGTRYKMGDNGKIVLRNGCGQCLTE